MVVVVVDAKEAFNTCDCSFGIIINIIGSSLVLIAGGAYRWRDIGLGTGGGMDGYGNRTKLRLAAFRIRSGSSVATHARLFVCWWLGYMCSDTSGRILRTTHHGR